MLVINLLLILKLFKGVFCLSKEEMMFLFSELEVVILVFGKLVWLSSWWVVVVSWVMLLELIWILMGWWLVVCSFLKIVMVLGILDFKML